MHDRKAFTLVECLVTVAIVGLWRPARRGRSAAQGVIAPPPMRREPAANRLGDERVPRPSWDAAHGHAPIEAIDRAYCESPFARILPELDQTTVYDAINFQVHQPPNVVAFQNATAAAVSVAIFLCPTDAIGASAATGPMNYG